jgi:hypothetical protein
MTDVTASDWQGNAHQMVAKRLRSVAKTLHGRTVAQLDNTAVLLSVQLICDPVGALTGCKLTKFQLSETFQRSYSYP